jgi:hypothetical protein
MALAPVIDFVASGGTAPLGASPWSNALSGFSSGQKMWLVFLLLVFSPILLVALPFIVPIAIVWMILNNNANKRHRDAPAAFQPGYYSQPQVQPPPTNPLSGSQPLAQQPALQTGSLISEAAPGSVVEDETRRLQIQ